MIQSSRHAARHSDPPGDSSAERHGSVGTESPDGLNPPQANPSNSDVNSFSSLDRPQPHDRPHQQPDKRPPGRLAGHHTWSNLLFVHWRVDPEQLAGLLPDSLQLDTFDGSAWVGLVPFHMSGVRPWWSPPVWGVSSFPETNVRTYVTAPGHDRGVWFFSLDAGSTLAVKIARRFWHLNYFRADLDIARRGDFIEYAGRRRDGDASYSLSVQPGQPAGTAADDAASGHAVPGTLEDFLVERYTLYTTTPAGRLLSGRVHHQPYGIRHASINRITQSMLVTNRIAVADEPDHVLFSEGVNVDVFPLRPCE